MYSTVHRYLVIVALVTSQICLPYPGEIINTIFNLFLVALAVLTTVTRLFLLLIYLRVESLGFGIFHLFVGSRFSLNTVSSICIFNYWWVSF
jgi:hypothetical protein